jgi:putative ABC transport system permease protein
MLLVITVALVTLAGLDAILTAWATVPAARHASALMRALGANSRQASSGLPAAQVLSALPGAILGVPLGVGLLKVAAGSWPASPPALWLVATVLGTLLAVAALTTVTAGIGARRAAAETLQPKLPDHDAAQRRGSTNSAA